MWKPILMFETGFRWTRIFVNCVFCKLKFCFFETIEKKNKFDNLECWGDSWLSIGVLRCYEKSRKEREAAT